MKKGFIQKLWMSKVTFAVAGTIIGVILGWIVAGSWNREAVKEEFIKKEWPEIREKLDSGHGFDLRVGTPNR